MAFTTPRTWVAGEIVTAALMNTHIRDNERYLKGLDGVVTTQAGLVIDNSLGSEYLKLPLLTTAQTGTVLTAEGQNAHDSQTHRIKFHDGTAVRSVVSTVDVDDTPVNGATTDPISSNWAYDFINTLTAQGDIAYASAAGVWARLAPGTSGYYLKTQGAAANPVWAVPPGAGAGTYTGDGTANRAIAHGLGTKPKLVQIIEKTGANAPAMYWIETSNDGAIIYSYATAGALTYVTGLTAMDATNFYVGKAGAYEETANGNTNTYSWVAWA